MPPSQELVIKSAFRVRFLHKAALPSLRGTTLAQIHISYILQVRIVLLPCTSAINELTACVKCAQTFSKIIFHYDALQVKFYGEGREIFLKLHTTHKRIENYSLSTKQSRSSSDTTSDNVIIPRASENHK